MFLCHSQDEAGTALASQTPGAEPELSFGSQNGNRTCLLNMFSSVQTGGIVKTSVFTRRVCKNRGFLLNLKGFQVEFS